MNNKLPNVVQLIIATLRLSVTAPDITDRFAAAGEVDWPALLGYADEHGLTSALYEAYKRAGVLPYVPPAALARMTQLHGENYRRQTCNRAEWLEIHRVLTEANVPHLLLNDPAFLVAPGMIRAGRQALQAAEVKQTRTKLRTSLWNQRWQGLRVNEPRFLWRDVQTRPVMGVPMPVFSNEYTVIYRAVCFAGRLIEGRARLHQLLDVACLLQQFPHLDWERIWAEVTQAGLVRFVYTSIFLAHHIFDAPLPSMNIWKRLASVTPPALINWLEQSAETELLAAHYQPSFTPKDYRLALLAAASLRERLSVICFGTLGSYRQWGKLW